MPSSSSRFPPLHPRNSLRKLRTAFSSSSTLSPSISPNRQSSTSPLSATNTVGSRLSALSFNNMSNLSLGSAMQSQRQIRRKKSIIELEQEDEKNLVGDEILAIVEPRPSVGTAYGGIEEILAGHV